MGLQHEARHSLCAGPAAGCAGSQGSGRWWSRHCSGTRAVVPASKEQLSDSRRSKQPVQRASRENAELRFTSGASAYPQSPPAPTARGQSQGGGARLAHVDEAALCSHPERHYSPAPRKTSPVWLSAEEKEGCGLAGKSQGPRRSSGGLWANTAAGHERPSSPGPVYRSAWPSLGVITAKCTDNTINKQAADSRGANMTPNV